MTQKGLTLLGQIQKISNIKNNSNTNNKVRIKIKFISNFIYLEVKNMSRKTNIMSDKLKEEIAKELGVYETVKKDGGWQNVSSRDCGNIVTKAIEIANRNV